MMTRKSFDACVSRRPFRPFEVRMVDKALNSFYSHQDVRHVPLLEPLLQDPVEDVRDSARELIESLKGK